MQDACPLSGVKRCPLFGSVSLYYFYRKSVGTKARCPLNGDVCYRSSGNFRRQKLFVRAVVYENLMYEIFHRSIKGMHVTTVRGRRYENILIRKFNGPKFF